jgi:hypothetical protein
MKATTTAGALAASAEPAINGNGAPGSAFADPASRARWTPRDQGSAEPLLRLAD